MKQLDIISNLVHLCARLQQKSDKKKVLIAARDRFGLRDILYLHPDGTQPPENALLFVHTRDEAWEEDLRHRHPWALQEFLRLGRERVLPRELSELGEARALLEDLGLGSRGLLVPLHGPAGQFAVLLALARGQDGEGEAPIVDVAALHFFAVHYFENVMTAMGEARRQVSEPLSRREAECLYWCAQGKSYWETSVILGIAERTVNHHMKMVRRKLGVQTNAQAVGRASMLGLFLDCGIAEDVAGR